MLESLKTKPIKMKKPNYEQVLDLAFESIDCDMSSLREAESLDEMILQLNRLKSSVEAFGLTNEIITTADPRLIDTIPAVPSLEAFTSCGTNYTSDAAVEGILDKIKETTVKWFTAVKNHFIKYKKYYITAIAIIGAAILACYGYQKFIVGKQLMPVTEAPAEVVTTINENIVKRSAAIAKMEEYKKKVSEAGDLTEVFGHGDDASKQAGSIVATLGKGVTNIQTAVPNVTNITGNTVSECVKSTEISRRAVEALHKQLGDLQRQLGTLNTTGVGSTEARKAIQTKIADTVGMIKASTIVAQTSKTIAHSATKLYA